MVKAHPTPIRREPPAPLVWVGLALTTLAIIAGFGALFRYSSRAGASGSVALRSLRSSSLTVDPTRHTLLLFAHPRCPCTQATMSELERIAGRCGDRVRILAFFLTSPELGDAADGSLWKRASRIPGVEVRADPSGIVAREFGVDTSGHVVLFAKDGELVFEGGITGARGHEGANLGKTAVETAVLEGAHACRSTSVFGCSLGLDSNPPERKPSP